MTTTPVIVSWSGGKDSALTLERLLSTGAHRIAALLTSVSPEFDRISIHGVRRAILRRQADELRLPLVEIPLKVGASNEAYEDAFGLGLERARQLASGVEMVAFGDLFLEEVREYRERLLARLGWKGLYPLWGEPTRSLAEHFIARGFRAVLTCVDTQQLDASFAGREFDGRLLAELPPSVDPCGERGEFHTCVYAGPILKAPLTVRTGERVLRDGRFQYCDLLDDASAADTMDAPSSQDGQ